MAIVFWSADDRLSLRDTCDEIQKELGDVTTIVVLDFVTSVINAPVSGRSVTTTIKAAITYSPMGGTS